MFGNMNQNPFMMPSQDGIIDIDAKNSTIDIDFAQSQNFSNGPMSYTGSSMMTTQAPIIEPLKERIVNRTIEHVVPHICPIRTKVINNHVYKHTYQPDYSCCEENVCTNIQCGSCCDF